MTSRTHGRRPGHAPTPAHPLARLRAALIALLALVSLTALTAPAHAADPLDVQGEITDQVGALAGQEPEVQAALDRLSADTPLQLFVVYVDSFNGLDGVTWANETAIASGLGSEDILLAVAIGDRRYGISVDDAAPLTNEQLDKVRTEGIEPALSNDDWAGAAIAAADGYRAAYLGTGSGTGGGTGILTFLVIAAAIAGIVILLIVLRRRGRAKAPRAVVGPDGKPLPADSPELLPTEELNRRASSALVEIDDALKTSEQELGFAQAQFGLEATRTFTKVLEDARPAVARAFTLRQQLDDNTPETEPQARAMMLEIVRICAQVSDGLDDQAEGFDRLRALEARAPQVLDETEQRAAEVERRLGPTRATLARLATTHPPAALASVSANPDQAAALLEAARTAVAQGREEITMEDRTAAVAQARIAEDAVAQSVLLLDAVDRAQEDLASAGQRLDTGLASITADLADAARLAPSDPSTSAAAGVARERVAEAERARSGGDLLTALRHLTEAEAALDAALAPAREAAEQARRAQAMLADLMGRVNSQVQAVNTFIETRRGAVGPEPRTRLAEAIRHLGDAAAQQAANPQAALASAQQAERLVQQAQALAQRDVQAWEQSQRGGYGPGAPGGGVNAGSLVLGGILLDSMMRGGGGRSGGFSGGSIGGASRPSSGRSSSPSRSFGGGRSAGSFGGGGSRGRRGGGGRF